MFLIFTNINHIDTSEENLLFCDSLDGQCTDIFKAILKQVYFSYFICIVGSVNEAYWLKKKSQLITYSNINYIVIKINQLRAN